MKWTTRRKKEHFNIIYSSITNIILGKCCANKLAVNVTVGSYVIYCFNILFLYISYIYRYLICTRLPCCRTDFTGITSLFLGWLYKISFFVHFQNQARRFKLSLHEDEFANIQWSYVSCCINTSPPQRICFITSYSSSLLLKVFLSSQSTAVFF